MSFNFSLLRVSLLCKWIDIDQNSIGCSIPSAKHLLGEDKLLVRNGPWEELYMKNNRGSV